MLPVRNLRLRAMCLWLLPLAGRRTLSLQVRTDVSVTLAIFRRCPKLIALPECRIVLPIIKEVFAQLQHQQARLGQLLTTRLWNRFLALYGIGRNRAIGGVRLKDIADALLFQGRQPHAQQLMAQEVSLQVISI